LEEYKVLGVPFVKSKREHGFGSVLHIKTEATNRMDAESDMCLHQQRKADHLKNGKQLRRTEFGLKMRCYEHIRFSTLEHLLQKFWGTQEILKGLF